MNSSARRSPTTSTRRPRRARTSEWRRSGGGPSMGDRSVMVREWARYRLLQDQVDRLTKSVHDAVDGETRRRLVSRARAIPGPHQDAAGPGVRGELDVQPFVADH